MRLWMCISQHSTRKTVLKLGKSAPGISYSGDSRAKPSGMGRDPENTAAGSHFPWARGHTGRDGGLGGAGGTGPREGPAGAKLELQREHSHGQRLPVTQPGGEMQGFSLLQPSCFHQCLPWAIGGAWETQTLRAEPGLPGTDGPEGVCTARAPRSTRCPAQSVNGSDSPSFPSYH